MTEARKPTPEFGGTLAMFPELARARELYIELFKDRTPLVNLGYNTRQIEFTIPTLRIVELEGEVVTRLKDPYLYFENTDYFYEWVTISHLPSKQGFFLFADKEESGREGLTPIERLLKMLMGNPLKVLNDYWAVARIALFEESADVENLTYLIPELYAGEGVEFPLKREGMITKVSRALGFTATYRVAWVDEQTKLQFAVEVTEPKDIKPEYAIWRRLKAISDTRGLVIPIGRMANVSQETVGRTLSESQRKIFSYL